MFVSGYTNKIGNYPDGVSLYGENDASFGFFTQYRRAGYPSWTLGYPREFSYNVSYELRFLHRPSRLSGYFKIDWHEVELAAPYGPYVFDRAEFPASSRECGFHTSVNSRRRLVCGKSPIGFSLGGASLSLTTNASRVSIFTSSVYNSFVDKSTWIGCFARTGMEYAELQGELPTHGTRLRFAPVWASQYQSWVYRSDGTSLGIPSTHSQVLGWIALDDTSAVYSVYGASLVDPLGDYIYYATPFIVGGDITSLGSLSGAMPTYPPDYAELNAIIDFSTLSGIYVMAGRGVPSGPGVSVVPRSYVWDGITPVGYNPLNRETWCVSPVYTIPEIEDDNTRYITRPFHYLRTGQSPFVATY